MIATDDAQLEENFELELVSSRDEFHLKWKMKEMSPRQKEPETKSLSLSQLRFQKLKLYSVGLKSWNSSLSIWKAETLLSRSHLSLSQKLKLSRSQLSYSLGLNSLCPSLSPSQLALTGSGDHRKSGKKFLFHLPLLNKNFPMTLYVPCKCIFRNFFF